MGRPRLYDELFGAKVRSIEAAPMIGTFVTFGCGCWIRLGGDGAVREREACGNHLHRAVRVLAAVTPQDWWWPV